MKVALDKVIEIVTDCKPSGETDISSVSIFTGIKEFKVRIEYIYFFPFRIRGTSLDVVSMFWYNILGQMLPKSRYFSLRQCYSVKT